MAFFAFALSLRFECRKKKLQIKWKYRSYCQNVQFAYNKIIFYSLLRASFMHKIYFVILHNDNEMSRFADDYLSIE